MKKSTRNLLIVVLFTLLSTAIFWAVRDKMIKENELECWARLHTRSMVDSCELKSFSDVFFSFHGNGEGYFLADGTASCQNEPPKAVGGLINFSYKKQGDYYSVHMKERNAPLSEIFMILRYNDIKLKITQLNSSDYILTLPNETLLICTED